MHSPHGCEAARVGAPSRLAREVRRDDVIDDDSAAEGAHVVHSRALHDGHSRNRDGDGAGAGRRRSEDDVTDLDVRGDGNRRQVAAGGCIAIK